MTITNDEITLAEERHVPGTELLFDTKAHHGEAAGMQFIQRNGVNVFLVPQPSLTDINDPLKWSPRKKWGTYLNGVAYAFMGSVTGPIMAAGMNSLAATYGTTLQRISYCNGATLICQGVGNIFWMPLTLKIGRRPVYLASNILMCMACVWLGSASSTSYASLLAGRAFLGFAEAPIESIVPTTITDIFFLHDRGEKVSLYGLGVLGGNELGPLFSALIIQRYGMGWAFYIVAAFIGLSVVFMFLLMPETKFSGTRPDPYHHLSVDGDIDFTDRASAQNIERISGNADADVNDTASTPGGNAKHSFLRTLKPWSRPDPNINLLKVFLRPFVLLAYPTVVWASLVYGCSLAWNVIMGATVAQLFTVQYGFDAQAQGLVFLSPFIGSLVGSWLCGSLSDTVANYYTRRNEGIREPEMRLPVCVLATALTFGGALLAGLSYHFHTHYMGPVIGWGIISAGAQMGVSLSMSYALDCHKELSVELMVTIASLKSAIAWIYTWVINDWIDASGMLTVFMIVATINVILHLTTFVFYLKGKSIRIWITEAQMLARCELV
ncbi:hypothetical protein SEUCBS139899_002566 [Sporothrix eucalyptigena]|uniref:Major facilitator superfamily (MFS) profile domain-containing protein n=1 Tax=Sporothrix eucalyptigena TaxID=1812306 RepID=A0ABP0B3G2_9PEZI